MTQTLGGASGRVLLGGLFGAGGLLGRVQLLKQFANLTVEPLVLLVRALRFAGAGELKIPGPADVTGTNKKNK